MPTITVIDDQNDPGTYFAKPAGAGVSYTTLSRAIQSLCSTGELEPVDPPVGPGSTLAFRLGSAQEKVQDAADVNEALEELLEEKLADLQAPQG